MTKPIDALVEALEAAQNGLRWYQDMYPLAGSGADDEMHEHIDTALALTRAEQAEPQPVASELAQTAPECIWLQVNPDAVADSGLPFPDEHDNVTWCDESIGGEEVKYVRADLATPPAPVQAVEPLTAWQPQFEAISHKQETLVREFCAEIAGPFGGVGNPPDPVRLLEMAQALYEAERDDLAAAPPLPKGGA